MITRCVNRMAGHSVHGDGAGHHGTMNSTVKGERARGAEGVRERGASGHVAAVESSVRAAGRAAGSRVRRGIFVGPGNRGTDTDRSAGWIERGVLHPDFISARAAAR